jgi:6-phosphofructokinase 1
VKKVYDEHKMCVVAISEGITDASGNPIVVSLRKDCEVDAHGNVSLSGSWVIGDLLSRKIKEQLGISRVRSDTFGYLQRSFLGCVSDVDQHEAREVGERAVQMAVWNNVDGSIAIRRTGYYSVDYRLQSLADVAGQTRVMPDEFINSAGNHVTDAFKFYVRPLMGSGLPSPSQLRAPKVPKLLNDSNH